MIYLRHIFAASGLAVPATVVVVVDDVDWLVAQVQSEMHELVPDAQVQVNSPLAGPGGDHPDLLVVVYAAGTRPEEHLERLGRRARETRIGVALYCVDDRCFELVRSGDVERWTKGKRRRRVVLRWSRRFPSMWIRVVRRLVAG
jgi:hypothetical protein